MRFKVVIMRVARILNFLDHTVEMEITLTRNVFVTKDDDDDDFLEEKKKLCCLM